VGELLGVAIGFLAYSMVQLQQLDVDVMVAVVVDAGLSGR
jgi:hypothetical protein